jgi:Pyruvate/2-oxoglutarate dehydrogenase complex, dihydrolipoamide acyltransferase (E2) component, and related enzymes
MPKQGLQMTEGTITRWLVPVGGHATAGEPLFEMETDKLTITINSDFTGILLKVLAQEGDVVPITAPIAYIGENGEVLPDTQSLSATKEVSPPVLPELPKPAATTEPLKQTVRNIAVPQTRGRIFATPRAKTRAGERGIELDLVVGSGPDGLVTERDVIAYVPPVLNVSHYEKLWVNTDFSASAALIARSDTLDARKFISRALNAALRLFPDLASAFGDNPTVDVAVGVDGFEPSQSGAAASLAAAICGDGKAAFMLFYSDPALRGDAVKLLDILKIMCASPELALCI